MEWTVFLVLKHCKFRHYSGIRARDKPTRYLLTNGAVPTLNKKTMDINTDDGGVIDGEINVVLAEWAGKQCHCSYNRPGYCIMVENGHLSKASLKESFSFFWLFY